MTSCGIPTPPQVEPFITALWRVNKTMIKTVMLWLVVCFSAAAAGKGDEKFIRGGPPMLRAQGLFASCAGRLQHTASGSKSLLLEQEAQGDRGNGAKQGWWVRCVQRSLQGGGKAIQTAQPLSVGCLWAAGARCRKQGHFVWVGLLAQLFGRG